MKISYHAPFSINEYLKDEVTEKFKKLENLQLRFSEADVYFKMKDGKETLKDKEVEIKIHVPGQVLFAKSFADTFEKSIPLAVDKMRKQIIKYKENFEPKRGK